EARYADFLGHRAFEGARARGTRMVGDYPALRAQLTPPPPPDTMAPLALERIPPAAFAAEAGRLSQSPALLEEPELRTWFLTAERLAPFLDELAGAKDSPLVLNQVQQQERFE